MYDSIKPRALNQAWGVYDPADYSQFGFSRHNGRDLRLSPSKNIYAGFAWTCVKRAYQPNGGGVYVSLISKEAFDFPAFSCWTPDGVPIKFPAGSYHILSDFLHCDSIIVNEGDTGIAGDLIAIGDNTGFSTGAHCHQQDRRVTWDGKVFTFVDENDANGSFDPTQFMPGVYAEDVRTLTQKYQALIPLLQSLIGALKGRPN